MEDSRILRLNWNNPQKDQMEAVYELAQDEALEPSMLMQPLGKEFWRNAALVLLLWGPKRVGGYWSELIDWLQDLNWPGSYYIMELLYQFPETQLRSWLLEKKKEALDTDDVSWAITIDKMLDKEWKHKVLIQTHTLPYR